MLPQYNTRDLMDRLGWKFRVLFETNMTMKLGLWGELTRAAGMHALKPTSMAPRDWEKLLRSHGLIWVGAMSGIDESAYGHSFIMYGMKPGLAGAQHVRMINPDGARDWDIGYESFNIAYENASAANYPQVRYFPYKS